MQKHPADGCFQERTQSMSNLERKSHIICFQDPHQDWAELPEFGMRCIRNYLGNGKVPLLPVWKGIYFRNQPEVTCKYQQETYDCH